MRPNGERLVSSGRGWAVLPLVVALLSNEWTVGALLAEDGVVDGTAAWALRAVSGGALLLAATLLVVGGSIWGWYRVAVLAVFHAMFLLVGLNALVGWGVERPRHPHFMSLGEFARADPDRVISLFGVDSMEEVRALYPSDTLVPDPSLDFAVRPAREGQQTTGPHGERVSCRDGVPIEPVLDGAIWLFGGSTTWGVGVTDCDTIPSVMNGLLPRETVVNLGVPAYGRNAEIDRLFHLLRQGHRPRAVLFLDGLNDIDYATRHFPAFVAQEAPVEPTLSYARSVLADDRALASTLVGRQPLAMMAASSRPTAPGDIVPCVADPTGPEAERWRSLYIADPATHLARQNAHKRAIGNLGRAELAPEVLETCGRRLVDFYRSDEVFLRQISDGLGVEVLSFFQPLGLLAPANPFIRDWASYRNSARHAFTEHLADRVRRAIAADELPDMVDLSSVGLECDRCWIDFTHYSAEMNRRVAEAMVDALRDRRIAR